MPAVSIHEQIKKLVALQTIDVEIYNFKRELKEKPAFLEDLKNKYEGSKAGLKILEDKLKSVQVDRKGKELELQSKEEAIVKANTQLSLLKTNKEYQAKLLEIENLKVDKSQMEEKILQSFDESDALTGQIDEEKSAVAQAEKVYLSKKKETENSIKEIQEKIKLQELKRNQIVPEVDKIHLIRYEKILENKDGLAIVPVKDMVCGGCYMNITQQTINEIRMHDKLMFCERCARIIYLEDDL